MEITIKELLAQTISQIEDVNVPIALADEIARPLCGAVANLKVIYNALEEPKDEPKEGDADGV